MHLRHGQPEGTEDVVVVVVVVVVAACRAKLFCRNIFKARAKTYQTLSSSNVIVGLGVPGQEGFRQATDHIARPHHREMPLDKGEQKSTHLLPNSG